MQTRSKSGIFKPKYNVIFAHSALISALITSQEPKGIKSALKFPAWVAAMDEELSALKTNKTWELVPRPAA